MSVITALKVQAKNKERVNVYLDGGFFCGLQLETIIKYGLKINQEISDDKLESIQLESEKQVAFNKALNLISKRLKTQKELTTYLKKKGYVETVIKYVIDKLKEYNYINDANYAKMYMQASINRKGVRKIRQELLNKGVNSKIINKVLLDIPDQANEIELLANKYMQNKEKTVKNYSKLYAYLTRKGFTYEQIQPFIKRGER